VAHDILEAKQQYAKDIEERKERRKRAKEWLDE